MATSKFLKTAAERLGKLVSEMKTTEWQFQQATGAAITFAATQNPFVQKKLADLKGHIFHKGKIVASVYEDANGTEHFEKGGKTYVHDPKTDTYIASPYKK